MSLQIGCKTAMFESIENNFAKASFNKVKWNVHFKWIFKSLIQYLKMMSNYNHQMIWFVTLTSESFVYN